MWRRLNPDVKVGRIRISWSLVASVDREVHLTVTSEELGLEQVEDWLWARLIGRIPGAGRE